MSVQPPVALEPQALASTYQPAKKPNRLARLLVPVLLLVYVLQCAWFIRTQSFTMDEPWHIVAGLEALHFGEFERWHDHPPLSHFVLAAPLVNTEVEYRDVDHLVQPVRPAPEVWLYRSRAMNVLLGVALLLLLWLTARRMFSEAAATFVLGLAVFSSELIAHFSLAMNDGAATLFLFAATLQWMRWRRSPTTGRTVLLGLLLGGLLLTKFNTPPMFVLVALLVLVCGPGSWRWSPKRWNWRSALALTGIACLVVWAGYFFHYSKVTFDGSNVNVTFSGGYTKLLTYPVPSPVRASFILPAAEYLTGFGMQVDHNNEGHPAFFLGHVTHEAGWTLYFPVAAVLKWPPIVLALAALGALIVWRRRLPARTELLWMSIVPAVYFAFALLTRINIGVRHILPVYPFLLLYAAAVWEWAAPRQKMLTALAALVLLQVADTMRYGPDYLSYFTPFVPPSQTYRLLTDSNLDWGQGLIALREYQATHPEPIHLAYFGPVDPAQYGIKYAPLAEKDRATGTVVVSATQLSGQLLDDPNAYHWLLAYPVKTVLNHSLWVFDVPPKR